MPEILVIALGGNTLIQHGESGALQEQYSKILDTTKELARLIAKGYRIVITHGNGPQIGIQALRHWYAKKVVPPYTLDIIGSETQGSIGYLIQQTLTNELRKSHIKKTSIALVTQVIVDINDPAFKNPTKPIGKFYSKNEVTILKKVYSDWNFINQAGQGFRRVVPSPDPKKIVEMDAIKLMVQKDIIVIASGGGGIPVIEENGLLKGVEAVIDKDLAAERLATQVGADRLIIVTNVDGAYINYNTARQKKLAFEKVEEVKRYYSEGHFEEGSMGPKILASIRFVEGGGQESIITKLGSLLDAIEHKCGTHILK